MNLSDKHSSTSRYSGKVLLASIMLVYYFIAFAVFMGYGTGIGALNSSKALKDKPKVGVVKGIVYSPPNSCAVVGETMMHVGDTIHEVVVVAIQSSKVKFSKDGATWQQAVLATPHAAWTN